mgnify:CR=1 FL=1
MINQEKIGKFIAALRKENQMTQEQLAQKLGVSNRSVSRWENGSNMPDLSMLVEIADYYDVEIREILDGERKSENMMKEEKETFSDRTIDAIVKACVEMSKAKTGALIVIENNVPLGEYERTGITLDALVSSQLLLNIFEHNTPLHDGAIIVRGNKIVSATCYLPLSDNMNLSKDLGTRHRAAVGISEVSDAMTVVVSEETGTISITQYSEIKRHIQAEELKEQLQTLQNKTSEGKRFRLWKGREKDEVKVNK